MNTRNLPSLFKDICDHAQINLQMIEPFPTGSGRAAWRGKCADGQGNFYFLKVAVSADQRYSLARDAEGARQFAEAFPHIQILKPVAVGQLPSCTYVLLPFVAIKRPADSSDANVLIQNIEDVKPIVRKTDSEFANEFANDLLSAWREAFHAEIKKLSVYRRLLKRVHDFPDITVGYEHGDFAVNNILCGDRGPTLIDFEFYRKLQPIGYDRFNFHMGFRINPGFQRYGQLHRLKFKLEFCVNYMVDHQKTHLSFCDQVKLEFRFFRSYNNLLLWLRGLLHG